MCTWTRWVQLGTVLLCLLTTAQVSAAPQVPVRVRAQLSTGVAKLGASIQLVVTAEGDRAARL